MPTHTSSVTEHQVFLRALPPGDPPGFHLMVYADRLDELGMPDAAHVLRRHNDYLAYRASVRTLHRSICSEVERAFGCQYAPERPVSDDPGPLTHPRYPYHLYTRKSSFLSFRAWPHVAGARLPYYRLLDCLAVFERRVDRLQPPAPYRLITVGRPILYAVAVLPLLHAHLAALPAVASG
ncbi:hypothetical protein [Gemmata sp.]|uniref:hypothetical protein n=1 Tax=Gemmata sp. TaxID=1914242 RepID=UPI003F71E155